MAFITLAGTLRDPTSELAVGDQIRFTHKSTTGETVEGAVSVLTIDPSGTYSKDLQYGLVLVEYKDARTSQFKNLGVATVNGSNPATSIPELLNALVPVSSAELIEFQAILADAVTARDEAEAFANSIDLINDLSQTYDFDTVVAMKSSVIVFPVGKVLKTKGYYAAGDAGAASYLIVVPQAFDGYGDHELSNGSIAVIQVSEGKISQYGAKDGQDNILHIQSAVNAHSVINLEGINGDISDSIDISKPVIMYGSGLEKSKHTRDAVVNAGVNTWGINISSTNAKNSVFRDFQILFTNVISNVTAGVHIGLNNTLAANVTTERCRFDGGNVGIHYKQVAGGLIQNNQIANMVNANNGVTGYGINTDGSDGVATFKNSIVQCERHAIYIAASNPLIIAQNQRHIANDIRWSGGASPSSQQAAIKVFHAKNITLIGNTGKGLKKAYWFTEDIDGLFAYGNTWEDMTVRGADDENIPTGALLQNIQINDKFDNCVTGIFATGGTGGVWRDLIADGSQFLNMTTGLQPTSAVKWSYNRCSFEDLTNGIFTAQGVTAPPMGQNDATFKNCTTNIANFPSGGNADLSGSTTPSVADSYNDYYIANTSATSITNFTGGYHGQVLTILFIQGSGTTTVQVGGGIESKSGSNIVPTGNASILTFKNIRGTWREV